MIEVNKISLFSCCKIKHEILDAGLADETHLNIHYINPAYSMTIQNDIFLPVRVSKFVSSKPKKTNNVSDSLID